MSISVLKLDPRAVGVTFGDEKMTVALADGRELRVPLSMFPRLANAPARQRSNWEFIGDGIGIHWPAIDEDISVESLLLPAAELLRYRETGSPGSRSRRKPRLESRLASKRRHPKK